MKERLLILSPGASAEGINELFVFVATGTLGAIIFLAASAVWSKIRGKGK